MWNAKVKEALTEFELSQLKTTTSRREEDQTPLVQYNSTSSTLYVPDRNSTWSTLKVPDRDVPPCPEVYRGNNGHNKLCCIWVLLMIVILPSVIVPVVITNKHSTKKQPTSVSPWRIQHPYELSLNTIIGTFTQVNCKNLSLIPGTVDMGLLLVLVATFQARTMFGSVNLSSLLHLLGLI